MKLTRIQLRKMIMEAVVAFPTEKALAGRLQSLRDELISMYDEGDPSMAAYGMASWWEQVGNAIDFVKGSVGSDLSQFDDVANEAYELLIDGRFHPGSDYNVLARADDVHDLDDEFDAYLDGIGQGDITELPDDYT